MPEGDEADVYAPFIQRRQLYLLTGTDPKFCSRGMGVGIAISKIWAGSWPDNCHSFLKPHVHINMTSFPIIFHMRFVADPRLV